MGKNNKLLLILIIVILVIAAIIVYFVLGPKKPSEKGTTKANVNAVNISNINAEIKDAKTQVLATVNNFEEITETTLSAEKVNAIGDEVNKIIEFGQEAIDPLLEQINSKDIKVRWLAVYCLALLSDQASASQQDKIIQAFTKLVETEPFMALKRQAAVFLFGSGEKEQTPLVIECLSSDELVIFSEPPRALKEFCLTALKYYTGQDLSDEIETWQDWWQENQDKINWSEVEKKYISK